MSDCTYREEALLRALANPEALTLRSSAEGTARATPGNRELLCEGRGSLISPDDLILTTSTSEAYSFVFRLLCDPGDAVLVPTPSYPLFDFLADIQDVKLVPYELVYDHGWQIDFPSLFAAMDRDEVGGRRAAARFWPCIPIILLART